MSHVRKYSILVISHWSMVVSLLGISRWSWVNGCLSLVIVFLGAVEASFDHVGANMGPLQGENPKICYQMHEKNRFGIKNCR